ncbi:MAG: hypothetical protein DMG55_32515 [Acidobacteria bacterium]|nr:MAG: hypothetical protein DMG55_32515 [Acidobacteriota bacterium]
MGKSHILQALGQKACVHGYRVLYRTSAKLISDLTASLADKTLPEKLRRYARPDFLIIDAFGCDLIERQESPQSAHLLYKIIDLRNQRKSTALATNVDFEKWGTIFPGRAIRVWGQRHHVSRFSTVFGRFCSEVVRAARRFFLAPWQMVLQPRRRKLNLPVISWHSLRRHTHATLPGEVGGITANGSGDPWTL